MTSTVTTGPSTKPEPRHIIVVDCETTALEPCDAPHPFQGPTDDWVYGVATEVAWWDLSTGEKGRFVAKHHVDWARSHGAIPALVVSKYLERLAAAEQDDGSEARRLAEVLAGNVLAGSTPGFDAKFLQPLFRRSNAPVHDPWHHRMLDLSNVTATNLGIPFSELPGLDKCCHLLGVDFPADAAHTAEGDVRAAGDCFLKLIDMRRQGEKSSAA